MIILVIRTHMIKFNPIRKKDIMAHEKYIEKILIFQAISSILQFIGDIIVEILTATEVFPSVDFRMAYTWLALLTAFTSFKTLDSMRKDEFGLVHEDIQITLISEMSLVICDFWFIYGLGNTDYLWIRIPFIVLTLINCIIMLHVMHKYKLWSLFYKGEVDIPVRIK